MKRHIESIYFLRLIAMLFVVGVHVTAAFSWALPVSGDAYEKYFFVNRIIRIEAGIFIMLTGMVFFYNYFSKKLTGQVLKGYFKKRVVFIVVPYIVWSLFYEVFSYFLGMRDLTIWGIVERIAKGESYYQLHFIFLIVQFYLVLPLLILMAQKVKLIKKYLWLVGIAIELIYYFSGNPYGSLFLNHIGTFLLGGWIGIYYAEEKDKIYQKTGLAWGFIALLSGVFGVYIYYSISVVGDYTLGWDVYKVVWLIYLLAGGYALFRLTEMFSERFSRPVVTSVKNIAMYSFGFYLLHPVVIWGVGEVIPIHSNYWFHIEIIARFIVVVVICYIIIWATHRFTPFASLVFGKLPPKATFIYQREQNKEEKKMAN